MSTTDKKYFEKCNTTEPPVEYNEVVNKDILKKICKDFEPDTFQKHGFVCIERNKDVFVTAHTSSGKTLIAEYGIIKHLMYNKGKRVIYTSPIKTLSNQKYYEFNCLINSLYKETEEEEYKRIEIGIITGDTQINPNGDLLIVTTEILRNYLYNNNDIINNLGCVIFDEVHYLNDKERGVVWEECLILLSISNIQLILLSATIGNPKEICEWISNMKKKKIYLITTNKRIIPLEYSLLRNGCVYDLKGTFKEEFKYKYLTAEEKILFNFFPYKINEKINEKKRENLFKQKLKIKSFNNQLLSIIKYIESLNQFPLLIFCLNKRKCKEISNKLINKKFTNQSNEVEEFIFNCLRNVDPLILKCEQLIFCFNLLKKGIAIHHSGLIPIIKEITELLIIKKFIKIIIATETYSMGVNAPMRSVLFLSLFKPSFNNFNNQFISFSNIRNNDITFSLSNKRLLFSNEFIQMSGRAGRRNLDIKGFVYIYEENLPGVNLINQLFGNSKNLISKFFISYSMVLNVLNSNYLWLLENSFKDFVIKYRQIELEKQIASLIIRDTASITKDAASITKDTAATTTSDSSNINIWNELINNISDFIKYNNPITINNKEISINIYNTLIEFYNNKQMTSSEHIKYLIKKKKVESTKYELINLTLKIIESIKLINKVTYEEFIKIENKIKVLKLEEEINYLKRIPYKEFNERINILESKGFIQLINKKYSLSLKGKMALELRTLYEIFFIDLLIKNVFKELNMIEFLCCVSCLLKNSNESFSLKYKDLLEINSSPFLLFNKIEDCLLNIEDETNDDYKINYFISLFLYCWISNVPLNLITNLFNISEGSISKLIMRISEMIKELINVFEISEIKEFKEFKNQDWDNLLRKKEIIFESLYLSSN